MGLGHGFLEEREIGQTLEGCQMAVSKQELSCEHRWLD